MLRYNEKGFKKACGVFFQSKKDGGMDKNELISLATELYRAGKLSQTNLETIKTLDTKSLCEILRPLVKDLQEGATISSKKEGEGIDFLVEGEEGEEELEEARERGQQKEQDF